MQKFAMVMFAAAVLSLGMFVTTLVMAQLAPKMTLVPTSATLKATCMSDGTMRIQSDAAAP